MSDPFLVMSAPNGARRGRAEHAALPLSPPELADCAASLVAAEAAILHLHVRDDAGRHSLDVDHYRSAIDAITRRIGDRLLIQVTTEACGIFNRDIQMQMVRDLRPEAVSLAIGELCPAGAEAEAAGFFAWLQAERILPQFILFSPDDVRRYAALRQQGVIPGAHPFVLFVLGRYAGDLTGDAAALPDFVDACPTDTAWAVCCFGRTESAAVDRAAALGGHARVGFENNLHLPDGALAADNAELVRLAVEAGRAHDRRPATADDVRAWFR